MIRALEATRLVAAAPLIFALGACAAGNRSGTPLAAAELSSLIAGNTLHIIETPVTGAGFAPAPCGPAPRVCPPGRVSTIFLAPDGGGWTDDQTHRGIAPWTGTMAQIVVWRVVPPSTICLTSAPLIGDMPSFSPPRHECIAVAKPASSPAPLLASVSRGGERWTGVLAVNAGNAFPPSLTNQYIDMVKVLYGQQMPHWPAG